jgi:hypothetical protein
VLSRPRIIACVFRNFYRGDKALPIFIWWSIVTDVDSVLAVDNEPTLNARASLLLTMSLSSATAIVRMAGQLYTVVAAIRELPDRIVAMLNSPASQAAFSVSLPTLQIQQNPLIQTVLSVTMVDISVLGWVCMRGSIALHRQLFDAGEPAQQDRLTLSLFTVAGHEICHGKFCEAAGNFNVHSTDAARCGYGVFRQSVRGLFAVIGNWFRSGSAAVRPDIIAETACGRAWERHLWSGDCPRWHQPTSLSAANKLARQLVARFNETQDFELTEDDARRMARFVGTRPACADEGGLLMSTFRARTGPHGYAKE